METKIGKITEAEFGIGGYNDAQIGLSLTFGSRKESWGCGSFSGFWADRPDRAQWSEADQAARFAETMRLLRDTLRAANKQHVAELVGVPVECTFDGNILKSWRVLEEAI